MTKGKRTIHYNLRKKDPSPYQFRQKKRKHTVQSPDCPCPPGYFDSKTGICHCACHRQDNTEPNHEPSGLPRRNSPISPSILPQDYLTRLDQEAATQARQPRPSTSFQAVTQARHTSLPQEFYFSSCSTSADLHESSNNSESETEHDEEKKQHLSYDLQATARSSKYRKTLKNQSCKQTPHIKQELQ